jgi:predicted RNA-binding protein with RPS1 domain
VDDATQRIALGLKQLSEDPWSTAGARYEVGQVVTGRVTRLAQFGAFVELEPGVEGLVHVSAFAPSGQSNAWSKAVPAGTMLTCELLAVDLEKKRIGLAPVPDGTSRAAGTTGGTPESDDLREYTAREDTASRESFGSLADKLRGALKPREK